MKSFKQNFDIRDKNHVLEYAFYLENNKWRNGCPFKLEEPFASIPHMIERKISEMFCVLTKDGYFE